MSKNQPTAQPNQGVQVAPPSQQINPFAGNQHASHVNAGTVEIEQSRAVAEAQGKLLIAKRFPRNEAQAYAKVIESCSRPVLANMAVYAYPRGGQTVSGPSIRLAEELARIWGNIDFGVRELSQRNGESEMEAYCWDMETNVFSSQKFTVRHERHTRTGVTKLTDPRDIYEATANMAGRRLRSRIMAVLPPDLIDAAVTRCRQTLAGNSQEPIADRIRKMLVAFAAYGVNQAHIEAKLGVKVENLTIDHLVELTTIYNSLKDGQFKTSDYFNVPAAGSAGTGVDELNQKLGEKF